MRSMKGSVSWQVGHVTLKNASSTGPDASAPARFCLALPSSVAKSNSGACAPACSVRGCFADAMARLFFLHRLDEVQDVELLQFAIREEAIDGVLLVVEDFEYGGEFCHHQQFDLTPRQVEQLNSAAGLLLRGEDHYQRAKAGRIHVVDALHVENGFAVTRGQVLTQVFAKLGRFIAHCQTAFDVDDGYAFVFTLMKFDRHEFDLDRKLDADLCFHFFDSHHFDGVPGTAVEKRAVQTFADAFL